MEKSATSPSTKNQKRLCKSTLYAVTNLELTSSRILSLQSLNCYTSIAGAVSPRMLSKQRTPYTLLSSQNATRIVCSEDFVFFKYTEMSIAPRGKRYFFQSPFCSRELALSRGVSSHSVSTQHREYQASIFLL